MSLFSKFFPQLASIRSRLVLLVLLSLVPVALVLIYSALENRRLTGEQAINKLSTIVELIHNDFEDAIYASSQLLTSLSLTPEKWLKASPQCNQQLANLSKQFASYSNIYSVDLNGEVICTATNNETTINLLDRDYIQNSLSGGAIIVGQPVEGKISKQMVMPIALPLYSSTGEIMGVVGVSINLSLFLNHNLRAHSLNSKSLNNVTVTLWQPDGTVLVRAPDPFSMTGLQARESELFQTLIGNTTNRQTMEVRGLDNTPRWYAFDQIGLGESNILLSVGLPTEELFAEVDAIFWRTLSVLAVVSLLVILAAWFIAELAVRRPVSKLASLVEQVSSGQRGIRIGQMVGASELKTLAHNFDLMVSYLESYENKQAANQQALTQAKESLELKVQERTLALESASREAIDRAKLLEKQRLEITVMNELTDMLQSCHTLDESWPIIGRSLTQLFEDLEGTIYTYRDSGNALMHGVSWGKKAIEKHDGFAPDDCWSLRLGRSWQFEPEGLHTRCNHIAETEQGAYICIPMLADGKTLGVLHLQLPNNDGKQVFVELAQSAAARLALALSNIKLRQTLRNLSIKDVLTGLYNRRFVEEIFEHEVARCRRNDKSLSVLMIDVDHFKRFNDSFGHDAGDVVLRAVGSLLKESFRKTDFPCRLGGEEFLVILPECDGNAAFKVAEQLRLKISELVLFHQGKALDGVTASIGVATWPEPLKDEHILIAAADAALYSAKHAGRNQVHTAEKNDALKKG
jgi:diguanylate cyclase (GGDEF)-like protein